VSLATSWRFIVQPLWIRAYQEAGGAGTLGQAGWAGLGWLRIWCGGPAAQGF